jgi:hypothetical protein
LVVGRRDTDGSEASLDGIAERIWKLCGERATTVQSTDGPIAREAIRQFKRSTDRWIVAKEMISEGTNLPRLRIAVLLRDIGNRTFYEQLIHRITRNDADDRLQDAIVIQLQLPHLHEWGSDLERQALIGWQKQLQSRRASADDKERNDEIRRDIQGISADLTEETIIIEGDDFTREDPIGRRLHELIGLETKTSRWQLDKALKVLPALGIPLNITAPMRGDELVSAEEEFARRRERGVKWCKAAGKLLGDSEAIRNVIYECKRSAGIRGKLEDVIRDDPNAIVKIKAFEDAAWKALQNAKRMKSQQGELRV